eukprot:TRINITY_DN35568_c0_g1_i1.p1 TRINITY_DN35568_c0_g1~~TRINITY_DN35568_c0_g1_i1.p1  ORF type:complete len:1427 (-),score=268.55 TRINITY_DN35568_c0_g1_i1:42-4298(-)
MHHGARLLRQWYRRAVEKIQKLVICLLLRVMLASKRSDEQVKPERLVLLPAEYPGTPPPSRDAKRADELRQDGNTAYAEGRFDEAIQLYSEAALLNPADHLAYSNRSACWARLSRPIEALDDADLCVRLAPDFARGFLRKGTAEAMLNRRLDAEASFKRGLELDPENVVLVQALQSLHSDSGGLQATLYQVLFVSPRLQMDRLFQALEEPDRLTAAYVEEKKLELDQQFECLTQTLRVDQTSLLASPVLRDAYDRVTFACGQLLQWAPEAVSKHLNQGRSIVEGLGLALRCGWSIHHGVAKFSANALTILATSDGAEDSLRREAVRLLLGGMLRWLLDLTKEPENPPEDRDVCGCTFLAPRLSAATWLERLFEHGTKPWVREECERFSGIVPLVIHLCLVVRDENAVPLGFPCLLRLPAVAKAVMESDVIIDLATCCNLEAGKKDGRRWLARQRSKLEKGEAQPAAATASAIATEGAEVEEPDTNSEDTVGSSQGEGRTKPPAQTQFAPPAQRLGEWIMCSLGYLLIFVDDDALFAAHACSALHRMTIVVPDGVTRLAQGMWMGLPMLERLSMLACQHSAALELLETLARRSSATRVAMCSLAAELSTSSQNTGKEQIHIQSLKADTDPVASEPLETVQAATAVEENKPTENEVEVSADPGVSEVESHEHEHEGLGEPSWVECYYELHDELWVSSGGPEHVTQRPSSLKQPSLVMLGNFQDVAPQVPVLGRVEVEVVLGTEKLEAPILPAVWNPRFDDLVTSRLVLDETNEIGGTGWHGGKEGAVVMILRSMIQKSPATPDWASAIMFCAEAGARAAIVVNDTASDGPLQPAFRMGLFGSSAPPIPAFMIGGTNAEPIRHLARENRQTLSASVYSVGNVPSRLLMPCDSAASSSSSASSSAPELSPPPWPLVLRVPQDVAQAWSLVETVQRAAPSLQLSDVLTALAGRMGLHEKRTWLQRRLQRCHRGDTDADEPMELSLSFVECDRNSDQLRQLRKQLIDKTGLAAPNITGEFEVRFKDESSVGSAVMREWMDLIAQKAFLPRENCLLISYDNGISFLPNPSAPFLNAQWQGDFELLGRLLGLALWHQVTLDLPLHPYICDLLLQDGIDGGTASRDQDTTQLEDIDAELCKHKVKWLLSNDVSALGFEMTFTDSLTWEMPTASPAAKSSQDVEQESENMPPLQEVVSPGDALPGDQQADEPLRIPVGSPGTQVELVPGGAEIEVTESNKEDFVSALLDWRLRGSLEKPVAAMVRGFRAAAPSSVLAEARQMLSPLEVRLLMAGSRDIDANDWQRNTRTVGGLQQNSQEVRWFWQVVHQWAKEGRQDRMQDLLQFATGSRRVPVGGFAQLVGFNGGRHLFTLAKGVHLSSKSLPTSHACICTVDLPPWECFEDAERKLTAATEAGKARFDEGLARARD